ncbi:MAG: GNAT family N-acetyltransferase, partial [Acidobacteriota bacterium]|nr:GNAT family N-acetyltransferase [Acidobacteriota bacterium]
MKNPAIDVRQATIEDLDLIVPLFDAYREFYRQPSEPERAIVIPEARRRGVASALLRGAAEYGRRVHTLRLTLSTEITNTAAQA